MKGKRKSEQGDGEDLKDSPKKKQKISGNTNNLYFLITSLQVLQNSLCPDAILCCLPTVFLILDILLQEIVD